MMHLAFLIAQIIAPAPLQPTPSERGGVVNVDLIVLNQYCQTSETEDGRLQSRVSWYTSFWNIHYLPAAGFCRVPVFEHRGWIKTKPIVNTAGGHAAFANGTMVVAPTLLYIVTGYDFEYKNRAWFRPINP